MQLGQVLACGQQRIQRSNLRTSKGFRRHVYSPVITRRPTYAEALDKYRAVLRFEPLNAVARRNLALVLCRVGCCGEGIEELEAILHSDRTMRRPREPLQSCCTKRGDPRSERPQRPLKACVAADPVSRSGRSPSRSGLERGLSVSTGARALARARPFQRSGPLAGTTESASQVPLPRGRLKGVSVEQAAGATSFAAIDFETANSSRDSACSVGFAIVTDGRIEALETRLIRPPTRQFEFTYIHGLSWEDVQHAPPFDSVWSEISPALSTVEFLCAHNASFDRGVLHACCDRYGLARPAKRFQCTVDLARSLWGIYPTKLPDVCRKLRIPLNHHEAGSDAQACARIVLAAIEQGWRWRHKSRSSANRARKPAWVTRPSSYR